MSELSTRFEPLAGKPYGQCINCDQLFYTPEVASLHMHETFEARGAGSSGGHRIRVTNLTRAQRVEDAVGQIVQDAIDEAISSISNLTMPRRGGLADATESEITEALDHCYDGFAEAWDEYINEEGDGDE